MEDCRLPGFGKLNNDGRWKPKGASRNNHVIIGGDKHKVCTECKKSYPIYREFDGKYWSNDFYQHKNTRDGLQSRCSGCMRHAALLAKQKKAGERSE